MSRIRSPNYPAMSLPEAIAKVKVIHEREQHLAAPKEVIAKHIGYSGLNGSANKSISALSKYGLLEEVGGDKIRVSPLALAILHPRSEEEKATAIKEAAEKPGLFVEIATEWPDGTPSDANLKAYLIRRNFASDAIERVIRSYRETIELVAQESGVYDGKKQPEEPKVNQTPLVQVSAPHPAAVEGASQHAFEGLDLGKVNNFSIVDQGSVIHVRGTVNRKGLDRLLKKLSAYKAVLDASADDDEEGDEGEG